jgi:cytochrome P450
MSESGAEVLAPSWDPADAKVLADQRAAYDEMRQRRPVAHSESLGWSVFRHRDVVAATADPATFSSATARLAIPNGMDPPEHEVYRQPLEKHFEAGHLGQFEPRSRQIARDLLDAMSGDTLDAISAFVDPFAHQALCAFMGWPVEDWNRISEWTHGNQDAAFRRDHEAGARLAREFATYVTDLLRARRAEPVARDLMGDLVGTTVHGELLSDDQIVGLLRTWTAGHGPVAAALGIVVKYLAEHPDLQSTLRARPELVDAAIWEILRTDGPLVANNRTTTRDVEVAGQPIPRGQRVSLMWIAANRDPDAFTDADRVSLDRDRDANLLFGMGIHRCLGEPLATLNLRVGVSELLARTETFSLGAAVPIRNVFPGNGLRTLPLRVRGLAQPREGAHRV